LEPIDSSESSDQSDHRDVDVRTRLLPDAFGLDLDREQRVEIERRARR
jgi:hypothetical protein